MKWLKVLDPQTQEHALQCAKSSYQRALLLRRENLSGSTLKGKAKLYGGKYATSRRNLLSRLTRANIPWAEERGQHGRRILMLGAP